MCFGPRIYNANKTTKKCIQFLNTIFYIKNSPRTWMFIDKNRQFTSPMAMENNFIGKRLAQEPG